MKPPSFWGIRALKRYSATPCWMKNGCGFVLCLWKKPDCPWKGDISMDNKPIYTSALSAEIDKFIAEKRSVGYKYAGEARIMRRFDEYWASHGYPRTGLTLETLEDWCQKSDTEGVGSLATRISVVRQFALYLNGLGLISCAVPIRVKYHPAFPHLFTKAELAELFHQIDTYESATCVHSLRRIAKEYPVLFRLIYLNGLRLGEVCRLAVSDVCFSNGVITIFDGKGNKDRLIYLSEDMKALCSEYLEYLHREIGQDCRWLFPGRKITDPIGRSTVDSIFTKFWNKTSFARDCSIKPTVHDLRHSYVVERINLWMAQGLNFDQMLPYLCKFLGHKTFSETYYYYHYTEEAAKTIHRMDKTADRVIPEVMRR